VRVVLAGFSLVESAGTCLQSIVAAAKEETTVGDPGDGTPVPAAPAGGFTPATSFFVSFTSPVAVGAAPPVAVPVAVPVFGVASGPAAGEVEAPASDDTDEDSPSTGTAFATNEREASAMSDRRRILT